MNPKPEGLPPALIGQNKLLAFVRTMIGASQGRQDDEHPLPPGPWDPVVRLALDQVQAFGQRAQHLRSYQAVYGPQPEPWKAQLAHILAHHPEALDAIGGGHSFGDEVSLNPQPLPPGMHS